ncbi:MAG TPA: hybrid sensor histidine kinase/response regulator [Chloroflexota bacterium]|nr:hybrid sensor histidine kinase/response regulator [Chloroflexota bacterium]
MALILAVDDNSDNLYLLERLLRSQRHTVQVALNGLAALDMARAETPDLVLLDLMMPDLDGFAVLERLKTEPTLSQVPVIMLTASDHDPARIARALSLGAHDYIAKPVEQVELLARVAAALRLHEVETALRRRGEDLAAALAAGEEARSQAEAHAAQAQAQAAQLEAMIASMAEGVLVYGQTGELISINAYGRRLLGLEGPDPLSSLTLPAALQGTPAGGGDQADESLLAQILRGETAQGIECGLERADRGRKVTILCSGSPLRDAAGGVTGGVVVISDISERKEVDRAKDDFIGLVAHELKTPLTGLKGHAQMLGMRLRRQEGREADLVNVAAIEEQISRMVDLINDMLDATRSQIGRLTVDAELVDVAALVREAVEHVRSTNDTHQFLIEAPSVLIWPCDPRRIGQVVTNLLGNALRYASGGQVTVTLAEVEHQLHLTVRDEGIGIPPSSLESIFARFEQGGTPHDQGLGLGLYISRGIVQAHGGRIWAESAGVGAGATFHVMLPCREPAD